MVPSAIASGGTGKMWQRRRGGVTAAATATMVVMALLLSMSRIEGQRALGFSLGTWSAKASPRISSLPSRSTYAAAATASSMDTSAAGGAAWHVVGCTALLLAAAARRLGQWPKSLPARGTTARRAFVVFSSETKAILPANMMSLDSEPALAPATAPQVALRKHSRAAARRVGQQRHHNNRHARRAFAQQSAVESGSRRRVGARLQEPIASEVPLPASFDPSRLRTQIQVGLRTSSQFRFACRRESRTAASSAKVACRGLRGLVLHCRRRSLDKCGHINFTKVQRQY